MDTDTALHHRRSIRLKGYDYCQEGVYCVTICTERCDCLFGDVTQWGEMRLNVYGKIVEREWLKTSALRPYVELDAFIVMPNHFHGILLIVGNVGAQRAAPLQTPLPVNIAESSETCVNQTNLDARPVSLNAITAPSSNTFACVDPGSLGEMVRSFKSAVTREINTLRNTPGQSVWQRNDYEQIIRNERMLNNFRRYLEANPAQWSEDRYFTSTFVQENLAL